MTKEEFRRHRDGEGSPEEVRDFFHIFMEKICGASARESDELLNDYVNTMTKAKMCDEDSEPEQEEKIVLSETEYEVL